MAAPPLAPIASPTSSYVTCTSPPSLISPILSIHDSYSQTGKSASLRSPPAHLDYLNRVGRYLEDHDCFTHHVIGFRPGLSTQDVVLLLKHRILNGGNTRDIRVILGFDLEKPHAHSSILKAIADSGLGRRFYDLVRSFLNRHRAVLRAGDLVSDEVELGQRETPQGSVLSPTLFNLVMIGLSERLSKIYGINHTIYAEA